MSTASSRNGVSQKCPATRDKTFRGQIRTGALLLIACLILPQIAAADWQVASTERESSTPAGVEHLHIVLQNSDQSATIDLATFSTKSATLHLIDNAAGSENLAAVMSRDNFLAGVNGGYFDTEFKPLGLRVISGTTRSPLIHASLLTGILCGSSRGIEIVRLAEFSQKNKCDAAMECGPFLIDRGLPVRGLDQARQARRTFVAITRNGTAALGVSSDLSLAQLASALSAVPEFRSWRALNLDGGSSSAFWFRRRGESFSIPGEKTVRDFVAIAPR